jgi:N-dimethylarginine dimethylaminohydrolase
VLNIEIATTTMNGSAGLTHFNKPTFLMCSPEWYGVDYVINPWMAGNLNRSSREASFGQWKRLHSELREVADVRLLHPRKGAPDMTFVAHGALINLGVAAVSRFAHTQRECEENPLRLWLEDAGFVIWETPRETPFEGEGDAMFDPFSGHLWLAHGPRTCQYSHSHVATAWHSEATSLRLLDPRFYHLDTCFAPLNGGHLLYYPGAFDADSLRKIEEKYPPRMRLTVDESEAAHFGCNVLNVGRTVLMHQYNGTVARRLRSAGYRVVELPLDEFLKGGGSAKSLALRLSDLAMTHEAGNA